MLDEIVICLFITVITFTSQLFVDIALFEAIIVNVTVPNGTEMLMKLDIMTNTQLEKIRKSELFSSMEEETVKEILSDERTSFRAYRKGETIFQPDVNDRCVGIVLSGMASATNEKGYLMRRLPQGSVFGVAGLFTEEKRYVSEIRAVKDTKAVMFAESLIEACITAYPQFARNYIRFLTDRIRFLNNRISLITSSSNTGRLMSYLLNVAQKQGDSLQLEVSYSQLSRGLNMARSSLYRALDELEEEGVILREGRRIVLLDYRKTEQSEIERE